VVLLEQVGSEQFPGEVMQLQDAEGNPWTAAAARIAAAAAATAGAEAADAADAVAGILATPVRSLLSAIIAEPNSSSPQQQQGQPPAKRLRSAGGTAVPGPGAAAAAAAGEEWRLHLQLVQGQRARRSDDADSSSQQQQQQEQRHVVAELPFDAEGCCRLQTASLQSLGITSTGEYSLIAVATRAGAGHSSKQVGRGSCRAFAVPWCQHVSTLKAYNCVHAGFPQAPTSCSLLQQA
jgi:hypothetical protein